MKVKDYDDILRSVQLNKTNIQMYFIDETITSISL